MLSSIAVNSFCDMMYLCRSFLLMLICLLSLCSLTAVRYGGVQILYIMFLKGHDCLSL